MPWTMCRVSEPELANIVIFFRVKENCRRKLRRLCSSRWVYKSGKNFDCVRLGEGGRSVTYTIFPESCCVVATGIRREKRIKSALRRFRVAAALDRSRGEILLPHTVTNSTYSGIVECSGKKEGREVSVCQAVSELYFGEEGGWEAEDDERWSIGFRSQFFPGLRLRWRGGGTVNLFNNGKYVLVGVRSREQANRLAAELCALMRRCWTTLGGVTWCAWTAASSSTVPPVAGEEVRVDSAGEKPRSCGPPQ